MPLQDQVGEPDARHTTAELIYQRLHEAKSAVSLATVYCVLLDFEKAGLVIRQQIEDGHAVFELNRGKHHDHLVCVTYGRIVEFVSEAIERQQKLVAEKAGFEIRHHSLTIYGVCGSRSCRGARNT